MARERSEDLPRLPRAGRRSRARRRPSRSNTPTRGARGRSDARPAGAAAARARRGPCRGRGLPRGRRRCRCRPRRRSPEERSRRTAAVKREDEQQRAHGVAAPGAEPRAGRDVLRDRDAGGKRAPERVFGRSDDLPGDVALPRRHVGSVRHDLELVRVRDLDHVAGRDRLHDGHDLVVAIGPPPQDLEEEVDLRRCESCERGLVHVSPCQARSRRARSASVSSALIAGLSSASFRASARSWTRLGFPPLVVSPPRGASCEPGRQASRS